MSKLKEKYIVVESHECTAAQGLSHILRFCAGKDTYVKFTRDKDKNVKLRILSPDTDYSMYVVVKPVSGKFFYVGLNKITYMKQVASFLFEVIDEISTIEITYCLEEVV